MFKYIQSFHSELPQDVKVIKAVRPCDRPAPKEVTIEPWIRKALDSNKKEVRRIG